MSDRARIVARREAAIESRGARRVEDSLSPDRDNGTITSKRQSAHRPMPQQSYELAPADLAARIVAASGASDVPANHTLARQEQELCEQWTARVESALAIASDGQPVPVALLDEIAELEARIGVLVMLQLTFEVRT